MPGLGTYESLLNAPSAVPALAPVARAVQEESNNPLMNALRFIGRPGFAARSLLAGQPIDAAENALQFLMDIPTGGWLNRKFSVANLFSDTGDITTREERPEFTDVLKAWGAPRPTSTLGKLGVDVAGGILTDPLTFLGGIGAAKGVAKGALTELAPNLVDDAVLAAMKTTRGGSGLVAGLSDDAAKQVARRSLLDQVDSLAPGGMGPRLGLSGRPEQAELLEAGLRGLADDGLIVRKGFQVGLPFGAKRAIATPGLEGAGTAYAKRYLGPALAGGVAAGGPGAALGVLGAAAVRKFRPDLATKADDLAREGTNWLQKKILDKTIGGLKVSAGFQAVGRDALQVMEGKRTEALNSVRKLFDGVDETQRAVVRDVLEEAHAVQEAAISAGRTPQTAAQMVPGLTASVAARAGIDPGKARDVVTGYIDSMKEVAEELKGFGVWPKNFDTSRLYIPRQAADDMMRALAEAGDDTVPILRRGWRQAFTDRYGKARTYNTAAEFEAAIQQKIQAAGLGHLLTGGARAATDDIADLMVSRLYRHAETFAKQGFLREAKGRGLGGSTSTALSKVAQDYMDDLFMPLEQRTKASAMLAEVNKVYKPALTVMFPGFHIRNAISTLWQTAMDPSKGGRDVAKLGWRYLRDLPVVNKLAGHSSDQVAKILRYFNNPLDPAARAAAQGLSVGRHSLDEVIDYAGRGVVGKQHFAKAELLEELGDGMVSGVMQKGKGGWTGVVEFMGEASKYIEDRARLSSFIGYLEKGVDPAQAIQKVGRQFVKYDFNSWQERVLRDLMPFARFTVGTVPEASKAIAMRPILATPFGRAAGSIEGDPEGAFLPEKVRRGFQLPLGGGKFLSSLGLPPEILAEASTFKGVSGQLHPLLKAALEKGSGRKFFTDQRFGTYTKAPETLKALGLTEKRKLPDGRTVEETPGWVREALSALPTSRLTSTVDRIFDPKTTGGKLGGAIHAFTGFRVDTPDVEKKAKQVLRDYLKGRMGSGDVGAIERLFARGTNVDPALKQALDALGALERQAREKRKKEN